MRDLPFFTLTGMTLTSVEGAEVGNDEVRIHVLDQAGVARTFRIYHSQDCCEHVAIKRVSGDMLPVKGTVTAANDDHPDDPPWWEGDGSDSHTWTRYVIATEHGRLEIWFLGESNGYYCETTDFEEVGS